MTNGSTIVFKAFGTDVETYETALVEAEHILSYELSRLPGDSFFIAADERPDATGTRQVTTVTWGGLIVIPPVIFDGNGMVLMILAGTNEALQSTVEQLPEGRGLKVVRARECTGPGNVSAGSSPSRRRGAVEAAVDCGYYREPRTGAVVDMAARPDCSTSTAAEYLRKVEMRVMTDLVGRP